MTDFDNRELTIDELDVVAGGKTGKPNEFILITGRRRRRSSPELA